MTDHRYKKLAHLLVNYSTALKKGDRILLDMIDVPDEFTVELIRAARAAMRDLQTARQTERSAHPARPARPARVSD